MVNIKNKINYSFKIFDKIFLCFLFMQPILDVIAGVMIHYNYGFTLSSLIRFIFMFLCIIYLIFYIKNKKINIYLLSILIYFIIYMVTILIYKGTPAISYEFKNLISTYYFVFILITLLQLYKNKKFNIKNLIILYVMYMLLVFIPNILDIGFKSYYESKEGCIGWFNSANVVGSILSILLPIVIIYIKKFKICLIPLIIINLYVIFSIGTKVPVLAFILVIGINILYFIIKLIKEKKNKIVAFIMIPFIIIIAFSIIIFPKTTFYKNIVIHLNYLEKKDNGNITTWHIIDHFVFSQRLSFEEKTRKSYNNSHPLEKIVGIGYIENYSTDKLRLKTVEIDYFDIFYRHGVLGFIIFFLPIVYVLKDIIKNKNKIDKYKLNIILCIALIFILALFQGHILVTPSNSIYVALILSLEKNKKIKD